MISWLKKYWYKIIAWVLFTRARYVLKKFDPLVIGITGSMGKTSVKEALYTVLSQKFSVIKSRGNLNNEIGLPLSIIGAQKPMGVLAWLWFFISSYFMVRKIDSYAAYLILEMGADKKGDIQYLCNLTRPAVGIVTNVADSHYEFFGSKKVIAREKRSLIESLPDIGRAVLNYDDEAVRLMAKKTKARVITYGLKKGADVSAQNIRVSLEGTSFKLVYNGSMMPVKLKAIGYPVVYSALAAVAAALSIEMDVLEIIEGLTKCCSIPGRMNLIEGKNGVIILDDSYNSSSKEAALMALKSIKALKISKRKVGILGSMWELGKLTRLTHMKVGQEAAKVFDYLICVEKHADLLAEGAMRAGMKRSAVATYASTDDLLLEIDKNIQKSDFVFVKGSQGRNRLEKVVKVLMKDQSKAAELLVRQTPEWKKN